jgi:TetR/AcrR family transcriptional regulator, transcriptional repressor for nem operon
MPILQLTERKTILTKQDNRSYYLLMPRILKKLTNRENLLSQGVTLLMQQGYHGTGLKEILDAVQIPKGSFYNYFGSKENFASEAIQHYIKPFIDQLSGHLQNPDNDALSALHCYFNELITELEKADYKGGCLLGNLMGEIGDTSDLCKKSLQSAVHRYRNLLQDGLLKAQQEGTVRTDKTAEDMADLLVNMWQGALLRMKIEQSSAPLKQCCENLLGDFFKA